MTTAIHLIVIITVGVVTIRVWESEQRAYMEPWMKVGHLMEEQCDRVVECTWQQGQEPNSHGGVSTCFVPPNTRYRQRLVFKAFL